MVGRVFEGREMNLSKKELNKLKSSILKRGLFIYSYIENEMKRLETKGIKISYFKEEFKEKEIIQIQASLLNKNKKYLAYYLTKLKDFASSQKLTIDFNAIDSLPNDEKIYLYALFSLYSDRYFFDRNDSYLILDAAFPSVLLSKEALSISGNKEVSLEAVQEANELFRKLRYPIDGKERYKQSYNKLKLGEHIIRLIEPRFWMKASKRAAYIKIDFSQPIDVIIEVIKSIKKTIDQDKHNILTANLYEVYIGETFEDLTPKLETVQNSVSSTY